MSCKNFIQGPDMKFVFKNFDLEKLIVLDHSDR